MSALRWLAGLFVGFLAAMGFAFKAGKDRERLNEVEGELDAIDKAKDVAEAVDVLPDGAALEQLRERYRRVLPTDGNHTSR